KRLEDSCFRENIIFPGLLDIVFSFRRSCGIFKCDGSLGPSILKPDPTQPWRKG
ncbi:18875_t:CDS:2, partial [Acaulospora morrowiae]